MESIITYMLKVIICSGLLYLYYIAALQNKRFNTYNRFYLLASFAISLLIPFLHFNWIPVKSDQHFTLQAFAGMLVPAARVQVPDTLSTANVLATIYIAGSSLLVIALVVKIHRIYKVRRVGTKTVLQGFNFIETNVSAAPFSFLNSLFWKKGMSLSDENGRRILLHELSHIKEGHSYDSLFTQLVICTCWINPFFWLLRKELCVVHEFIADSACIEDGDTKSFVNMLLYTYYEGNHNTLGHSFFNSSIKRRLAMIKSSKKTAYSILRRVSVLPVTIFLVVLFSLAGRAQTSSKNTATKGKSASPQIVDHVEVHGQTGVGDTGIVYLKNGEIERYVLNNAAENAVFQQKYGAILKSQEPAKIVNMVNVKDREAVNYEPLMTIPESISEITFSNNFIWLKRKDGGKEEYDLQNEQDRKDFEAKYGKLKEKR